MSDLGAKCSDSLARLRIDSLEISAVAFAVVGQFGSRFFRDLTQ
jgi:hypothetical protein